MSRRAGGDGVDLLRDRRRNFPGASRRSRHEPHPLEAHVVEIAVLDDVLVGVDRLLDAALGALNRLELRLALIDHLGSLRLLPVDARGSRDRGEQYRFSGLPRTRHRRQHARARMLHRDLREVRWQGRCGKGPRTVERGSLEPAAGDEEVVVPVEAHAKQIGLGVVDPEQRRRTFDLQVAGRSLEDDQLGGVRADEDLRHFLVRKLLPGDRVPDFVPVVVGGQLREAFRELAFHRGPRPGHCRGLEPRQVVPQVEHLAGRVLQEIPIGVERVAEIQALDRAPDWIAVEVHQNGGGGRPVHHRRVRLDVLGLTHLQGAGVHVGEDACEIDHPLVHRAGLNLGDQRLDLIRGKRLEVVLGDAQVHAHHFFVHGHAGRPLQLDGPHRRFLGAGRHIGDRRPRDDVLLVNPAFDLRLVPDGGAGVESQRAWPARVGIGAGRRGNRCGLGRWLGCGLGCGLRCGLGRGLGRRLRRGLGCGLGRGLGCGGRGLGLSTDQRALRHGERK